MNKAQSRQNDWKDFEYNQVFGKSIITFQEFHKVGVTVIMHASVKNHVRSTPQHVCTWKSCRHVENFTSTFSHLSLAHLTALLVHVSLSRYPRLAIWFKATHRGEKLRRCCKTATLALACVRHFIHPFTPKETPKKVVSKLELSCLALFDNTHEWRRDQEGVKLPRLSTTRYSWIVLPSRAMAMGPAGGRKYTCGFFTT